MGNRYIPTCDAIVSFDDAINWAKGLYHMHPDALIENAVKVEPAVISIAMDIAKRANKRLEKEGISPEVRELITKRIVLCGAVCIELMRRGNSQLWETFEDSNDETKE